jgi:hypothetical protein
MITEKFKVYKVDDVVPKEAYVREGTVMKVNDKKTAEVIWYDNREVVTELVSNLITSRGIAEDIAAGLNK